MRVLLVNAPRYRIQEPYYDTPPFPRSTLAFLAAYVREAGVDVQVLDCKFDRLGYDEAMKRVEAVNPDLVGFTAFTNEIIQAGRLAARVKAWRPDIKTVVGGVHLTALPERTLREFPQFDYGVTGEGEETLLALIRCRERGAEPDGIPGVCLLDRDGAYRHGGDRPAIVDQDALPMPAWDLFRPAKEYVIHTSRGCAYHCPFCMNPNGRRIRPRSPKKVIQELEWLYNYARPAALFIGDEIFTIPRSRAAAICRMMIDAGLHKKIKWQCHSHVRSIDRELAELLAAAGCFMVNMGIETGDEASLEEIAKGTSLAHIKQTSEMLRQARLPFCAMFILGHANETRETAMKTVDLAVELNPTVAAFGIMVPYPGTRVAEMAARGEGGFILNERDWNDYNKQIGDGLSLVGISRKELEWLQMWGYLKVFLWNKRFWDLTKFAWQYRGEGISLAKKLLRNLFGHEKHTRRRTPRTPGIAPAH